MNVYGITTIGRACNVNLEAKRDVFNGVSTYLKKKKSKYKTVSINQLMTFFNLRHCVHVEVEHDPVYIDILLINIFGTFSL